ncbi:MAG: hypothetical protein ACJAR2_001884 [Ilumatobacter sp.]
MSSTIDSERLRFNRDELMATHDYATPHVVAGRTLHGGFLEDGSYMPPRALGRVPALAAWEDALRARGGAPFPASSDLLGGARMPNTEQRLVLLGNGITDDFWNMLTVVGKIEARGAFIGLFPVPDLTEHIVEDTSAMAIGHLSTGLFEAHGVDEGGIPDLGIGGHDQMWFAARDLAYGPDAHLDVEPQPGLAREGGGRYLPEVAEEIESLFSFIANVLIIEFRAEIGFAETQEVLTTPGVWGDRSDDARLAAEIVGRIRTDEEIHVRSLNLYLGELQSITVRTIDGGTVSGAELVERFWGGMVAWATVDKPRLDAEATRVRLADRIALEPEATRIQAEFDAAAS